MAAKINRAVIINGEKKWVRANTEQEYADKLAKLFSPIHPVIQKEKHNFREYALNWFEVYSRPNIEKATAATYKRQLNLYLIPAFGDMAIEDIQPDDVQKMFNGMTGAKATKDKAKMVLNMILEAAMEDELIQKNPLKSRRVKITGNASQFTREYSVDQMRYLVLHLKDVQRDDDRMYLALQIFHPLRLEEVLGLKWEDVDLEYLTIYVHRAVTHPTRNQPEIKDTKTEASNRVMGLSRIAAMYLKPGAPDEFVLGGKTPLSYTQVRRMCNRIQRDTSFEENVTPIRFRTTVLTDIYDKTKDVKAAQAAAGHTTSAMTLKHYIRGRETARQSANAIDEIYGS